MHHVRNGAVIGATLLMLPVSAALAQNLSGSYQKTCRDIKMIDGVLIASCETLKSGQYMTSALPNAQACSGGISNLNGTLVCGKPGGSWKQSCIGYNVSRTNGVASADCRKKDGVTVRSYAGPAGAYTNCDGELRPNSSC